METSTESITWSAPSNIALVKYWGKHGDQLPCNPSVGLTLERSRTHMSFNWGARQSPGPGVELNFTFHQKKRPDFEKRVRQFLESLLPERPYLAELSLGIDARNTFPHSAGIASSASSMAALGLGLTSIECALQGLPLDGGGKRDEFWARASALSRRASGSACRSVYPLAAAWGRLPEVSGSSDERATAIEVHSSLQDMGDAILLVDSGEKGVSSRAGHGLMHGHPYAQARFERARGHASQAVTALRTGDWESLARITEAEALDLHAMMMTSDPWFTLMRPGTVGIIQKLSAWRASSRVPVCFTLDAGPNIHLIYPGNAREALKAFIQEELVEYLEDGRWIDDHVGPGPLSWEDHHAPSAHAGE